MITRGRAVAIGAFIGIFLGVLFYEVRVSGTSDPSPVIISICIFPAIGAVLGTIIGAIIGLVVDPIEISRDD